VFEANSRAEWKAVRPVTGGPGGYGQCAFAGSIGALGSGISIPAVSSGQEVTPDSHRRYGGNPGGNGRARHPPAGARGLPAGATRDNRLPTCATEAGAETEISTAGGASSRPRGGAANSTEAGAFPRGCAALRTCCFSWWLGHPEKLPRGDA